MKSPKDNDEAAYAAYVRFLELLKGSANAPESPRLEVFEDRLLDGLACLWGSGQQVTVLQAMRIDAGVSPTTVHRKLKSLRKKGLITLQESEADNRIKFVVPTPAAKKYLSAMGRCLLEAVN